MTAQTIDRLKFNPPLGHLPALQWLLLEQMQIDPGYQRSLETEASRILVRRIAQHWNWDLCQSLVVSRRGDGGLYVIDGQHRLAAARVRGDIHQLPAIVVNYARVEDEAASFVHLNQERRPLSRVDLFRAAVASGDAVATQIMAAIGAAGLTLAPHNNYTAWKPGMIVNVSGIEAVWRQNGPAVARTALHAMAEGFAGQVLRYAGTLYPGIAAAVAVELAGGAIDFPHALWPHFIAMIRGVDQTEWRARIMRMRAEDANLQYAGASARVFVQAWREALQAGVKDRLTADGDGAGGDRATCKPALQVAASVAPPAVAPAIAEVVDAGRLADGRKFPIATPPAPPVVPPAPRSTVRDRRPVVPARVFPSTQQRVGGAETFKADSEGKAWCRQCDARRVRAQVASCGDRFCPFGGKA